MLALIHSVPVTCCTYESLRYVQVEFEGTMIGSFHTKRLVSCLGTCMKIHNSQVNFRRFDQWIISKPPLAWISGCKQYIHWGASVESIPQQYQDERTKVHYTHFRYILSKTNHSKIIGWQETHWITFLSHN